MRTTLTIAAATLVLMLATATASADMIMFLDDASTAGIDLIIIDDVDGGVGDSTVLGNATTADGNAGDGIVSFNGTVGTFTVQITVGTSKPILGNQWEAILDLFSLSISGGAGEITVGISDTDYELDFPTGNMTNLILSLGGTTRGEVSAVAGVDFDNQNFAADYIIASPTFDGASNGGAFAWSDSTAVVYEDPFSLSLAVTVAHDGAGISSVDAELSLPVPEPGTLALLGVALVGAAVLNRRRRNNG